MHNMPGPHFFPITFWLLVASTVAEVVLSILLARRKPNGSQNMFAIYIWCITLWSVFALVTSLAGESYYNLYSSAYRVGGIVTTVLSALVIIDLYRQILRPYTKFLHWVPNAFGGAIVLSLSFSAAMSWYHPTLWPNALSAVTDSISRAIEIPTLVGLLALYVIATLLRVSVRHRAFGITAGMLFLSLTDVGLTSVIARAWADRVHIWFMWPLCSLIAMSVWIYYFATPETRMYTKEEVASVDFDRLLAEVREIIHERDER